MIDIMLTSTQQKQLSMKQESKEHPAQYRVNGLLLQKTISFEGEQEKEPGSDYKALIPEFINEFSDPAIAP